MAEYRVLVKELEVPTWRTDMVTRRRDRALARGYDIARNNRILVRVEDERGVLIDYMSEAR